MPRILALRTNNKAIANRKLKSPTSLLKPLLWGMNLIAEVGDLPEISGSFRAGGVTHLLFHFFHYLAQWNLNAINHGSTTPRYWRPG
ncbi:MAG TPA: hypothetical protein V6C85_12980 [Allocoleopsis sp.]